MVLLSSITRILRPCRLGLGLTALPVDTHFSLRSGGRRAPVVPTAAPREHNAPFNILMRRFQRLRPAVGRAAGLWLRPSRDAPLRGAAAPRSASYGSVAVFDETANLHSKARTDGQLVSPARRRHAPDRVDRAAEGLDTRDDARGATPRLAHRVLHAKRPVR